MTESADERGAADLLRRINEAWLEGRPRDLAPLFDPGIVMRYPGGRAEGRDAMVGGFVAFLESARVHTFEHDEPQVDVVGATAVASLGFTMVYEREGSRYRSTGRDLWVFSGDGGEWRAVWRTMLDLTDEPADEA
ncbi:MAG TPA: nuclear transport factor 2 family protein [Longimicrobium sp.]